MSRFHALLADDNALFARLLQASLERMGARVVHVRSAGEAARWLESRRPDLLVLDEALPDGVADDIWRRARALHPASPRSKPGDAASAIGPIPCILLRDHPALHETPDSGVPDPWARTCLTKPLELGVFEQVVAQTLGLRAPMATTAEALRPGWPTASQGWGP